MTQKYKKMALPSSMQSALDVPTHIISFVPATRPWTWKTRQDKQIELAKSIDGCSNAIIAIQDGPLYLGRFFAIV
jgi:hypothetical protein